jgi:cobalt-zinc-cadmium efflux system outer membrane protein
VLLPILYERFGESAVERAAGRGTAPIRAGDPALKPCKALGILLAAAGHPAYRPNRGYRRTKPPSPPRSMRIPACRPHWPRRQRRRRSARAESRAAHEFTVSGSYVRRSVDREGRFDEYDATGFTRPIRLPGKAALDRGSANTVVDAARNLAEDARHQAALGLAQRVVGLAGRGSAKRWSIGKGVANSRSSCWPPCAAAWRSAMQRMLEAEQVEAALADARLAAAQSTGRANFARARLIAQFPGLLMPQDAPKAPLPALPEASGATLSDQVVARSHEIAAADAHASRLAALAERARRDRLADPTIGLRLFSERNGAERGAGVVFSMPLGNAARRGAADRAHAEAQSAGAELALTRANVREMATGDAIKAEAAFAAWHRSREAVGAQVAALQKLRRGQQLGAIDLADVLLGERLTHGAFRNEAVARAEANRAINRLRIDSHNLWISD